MLTDSHCHLFKEYYNDLPSIIDNAQKNGVNRFIVDGCDKTSNQEVLELVKEYDCIYGCLGIHPENILEYKEEDLDFIKENLASKKIVGIGEIGLDYHYGKENKEAQKKLFRKQMQIACEWGLPVVIHSREATEDTINILKEFPKVTGVIHSFSLSKEVADIYLKLGYKLGINGVVTFKNCNLKEILPDILPNIILETDSPYLTPHPFRGTTNEPKYIKNIADFICQETNISLEELEKITNQNIKEVFRI